MPRTLNLHSCATTIGNSIGKAHAEIDARDEAEETDHSSQRFDEMVELLPDHLQDCIMDELENDFCVTWKAAGRRGLNKAELRELRRIRRAGYPQDGEGNPLPGGRIPVFFRVCQAAAASMSKATTEEMRRTGQEASFSTVSFHDGCLSSEDTFTSNVIEYRDVPAFLVAQGGAWISMQKDDIPLALHALWRQYMQSIADKNPHLVFAIGLSGPHKTNKITILFSASDLGLDRALITTETRLRRFWEFTTKSHVKRLLKRADYYSRGLRKQIVKQCRAILHKSRRRTIAISDLPTPLADAFSGPVSEHPIRSNSTTLHDLNKTDMKKFMWLSLFYKALQDPLSEMSQSIYSQRNRTIIKGRSGRVITLAVFFPANATEADLIDVQRHLLADPALSPAPLSPYDVPKGRSFRDLEGRGTSYMDLAAFDNAIHKDVNCCAAMIVFCSKGRLGGVITLQAQTFDDKPGSFTAHGMFGFLLPRPVPIAVLVKNAQLFSMLFTQRFSAHFAPDFLIDNDKNALIISAPKVPRSPLWNPEDVRRIYRQVIDDISLNPIVAFESEWASFVRLVSDAGLYGYGSSGDDVIEFLLKEARNRVSPGEMGEFRWKNSVAAAVEEIRPLLEKSQREGEIVQARVDRPAIVWKEPIPKPQSKVPWASSRKFGKA